MKSAYVKFCNQSPNKSRYMRYDLEEVKEIFQYLNVEAPIDAVTQIRKTHSDTTRGNVVNTPNEHYQKFIMWSNSRPTSNQLT